ncbi:hypothetical protein STEG23_036959, partial [Scotinomys teguina]
MPSPLPLPPMVGKGVDPTPLPAAAIRKVSPVPHLGTTVELALMVQKTTDKIIHTEHKWISQYSGDSQVQLKLPVPVLGLFTVFHMVEGRKIIYMVYYVDRLSYVESSLHLSHKAYLIMVNNVVDVFLESVFPYFLSIFASIFMRDIGLLFLGICFYWDSLLLLVLDLSVRPFISLLSFDLVDLSIGWNLPSSAFCKAGFVDSWSVSYIRS